MAKVILVMTLLLCGIFLPASIVSATTFTVGDDKGWTFGVNSWPNGKTFKAGDVLVFNYPKGDHNVIIVSEANYNSCTPSGQKFESGNDQITLSAGTTFFICGIGQHCKNNLKISVTAN